MAYKYSKLEFLDVRQTDSMQLTDQAWRIRNQGLLLEDRRVSKDLQDLHVEYQDVESLEYDFLTSGLIKAFSSDLVEFLKEKINAEFIPIKGLYNRKPYLDRKYQIVHLLDRLNAVDRQNSIYTEWPPEAGEGIHLFEKIVLDDSKVQDRPAFFLNDLAIMCFRSDLCESILNAGFKGIAFVPIDEYRNI